MRSRRGLLQLPIRQFADSVRRGAAKVRVELGAALLHIWAHVRAVWSAQSVARRIGATGVAAASLVLLGLLVVLLGSTGSPTGSPTRTGRQGDATSGATSAPASPGAPTATARPTASGQAQQAQPFIIEITCALASNGGDGKICVHTLPGAALTIRVTYCVAFGPVSSGALQTGTADSAGDYTWSWAVRSACRGTAAVYVVAQKDGKSASGSTTFTVQ